MRRKRNGDEMDQEEFRRDFARMERRDKDFFLRDALILKIRECKYFDATRIKMMQAFVSHIDSTIKKQS